jgi:hypothetical protein
MVVVNKWQAREARDHQLRTVPDQADGKQARQRQKIESTALFRPAETESERRVRASGYSTTLLMLVRYAAAQIAEAGDPFKTPMRL